MKAYRADKRDFQLGEVIRLAGEYVGAFSRDQRKVERCIDRGRDRHIPSRARSLFVFESLDAAKKHWSKMSEGKLYEVEIDDETIRHRGDMALVEQVHHAFQAGRDIKTLITAYWSGDLTDAPEVEIMVEEARVTAVLSKDQNERRQYLAKRLRLFE
jgi:hypothetical protein